MTQTPSDPTPQPTEPLQPQPGTDVPQSEPMEPAEEPVAVPDEDGEDETV